MGLDADIIAIGPFKREIVAYLEYPEKYYVGVPEGATVITTFIFCSTSNSSSRRLAEACGFGAWDLGKHKIDPERVNLALLDEVGQVASGYSEGAVIEEFTALRDAGFAFYYRPNG